eukprot:CAMPEP_0116836228 /NCGR_PEP_ID=MMETSP0418-20121206/7979_1 /TAXON_ID=1158023 /ORGANISM="Astrosyne radiata, Strain 13vi08-1A" /LENGTH=328 /DNA_ID=CAMNT_0004465973 /DNA_START=189 /DNA_END=1175 /DNA_ORIENTATION=+
MGGCVGLGISVLMDQFFYGFWTLPVLGNLQVNVFQGVGSLYGTHPFYWYLVCGIPAMVGLLLPILVYAGWWCVRRKETRFLWMMIACYVLLHSISPHKEFRFLLPMLPIFCLLASHEISNHKVPKRLRWFLVVVFCVANGLVFVFLGMIHQRAPLDANRDIRRQVSSLANAEAVVRVHYLMGCHATPAYSHLHVPPVRVEAWHLDCSPDCRVSQTCESHAFLDNPREFVETHYHPRGMPDFVAVFAAEAHLIRSQLEERGLEEVGRYTHSVNGARLLDWVLGDDYFHPAYSRYTLWEGLVDVSVDEMLLFARRRDYERNDTCGSQKEV